MHHRFPVYHLICCLVAGCLGAIAGCFGKFAPSAGSALPPPWSLAGQAACYGALVLCNLCMTVCFVEGAKGVPSLLATVTSVASNLVCTGALGAALFREPLSLRWAAGIACILLGLALVTRGALPAATAGSAAAAGEAAAAAGEAAAGAEAIAAPEATTPARRRRRQSAAGAGAGAGAGAAVAQSPPSSPPPAVGRRVQPPRSAKKSA